MRHLHVTVRTKSGKWRKLVMEKLESIEEIVMATQEDFDSSMGRIDAATTDIAGDLSALREQIAGMGLTAEQESTILGTLNSAASRLEGIGADPANPVPETTPGTP